MKSKDIIESLRKEIEYCEEAKKLTDVEMLEFYYLGRIQVAQYAIELLEL